MCYFTDVSFWSKDAYEAQKIRWQSTAQNDSVLDLNQQVKEVKVSESSRSAQDLSASIFS